MNTDDKQTHDGQVACEVCMKEIPQSEALTDEASDYVAYFCGLDCLDNWKGQTDKPEEPSS